jgi:hypothetical protein
VGGDVGAWGTELNTDLDGIDTQVKTTDTTAAAALPKAGGVMTGRVDSFTETVKIVAKGTLAGAQSLDLSTAQYFTIQQSAPITFSFTNPPATATAAFPLMIRLTNGGTGGQPVWPASVKWPSGTAPVFTTTGTDMVSFMSDDAGTTYRNCGLRLDVR